MAVWRLVSTTASCPSGTSGLPARRRVASQGPEDTRQGSVTSWQPPDQVRFRKTSADGDNISSFLTILFCTAPMLNQVLSVFINGENEPGDGAFPLSIVLFGN